MPKQPPDDLLRAFASVWQPVFGFLFNPAHGTGLRLTDWYRTKRENAQLADSAGLSQHLIGLAWDLNGPPATLARVARASRAAGLWVKDDYHPADHIHVQLFDVSHPGRRYLVERLVQLLAR